MPQHHPAALRPLELIVPAELYPARLGVFCDACRLEVVGDFVASDLMGRHAQLEVARAHVRTLGWSCGPAGDFCPTCAHEVAVRGTVTLLGSVLAAHSPMVGESAWDGSFCQDCTHRTMEYVRWPCTPVHAVAQVEAIGGGFRFTPWPAGVAA